MKTLKSTIDGLIQFPTWHTSVPTTPPTTPQHGDVYLNSNTGDLKMFVGSQWVTVAVGTGFPWPHNRVYGILNKLKVIQ